MLKQNKWKIILSTLATLIPMAAGLILWNRLPVEVAVHFGFDGAADGWSSKFFAVIALPGFMTLIHLFCILMTAADPKWKNIGKPMDLIFWLVPGISLGTCSMLFAYNLGVQISVGFFVSLLLGAIFVILGNVIPKAQQNYTFGIKLPWTLHDPENWRRTHRFAGWCMVGAGLAIIAGSPWASPWVVLIALALGGIAPIAYSLLFYLRQSKS